MQCILTSGTGSWIHALFPPSPLSRLINQGLPVFVNEVTLRSHTRDPAYYLLSERNPFQINSQQFLYFGTSIKNRMKCEGESEVSVRESGGVG